MTIMIPSSRCPPSHIGVDVSSSSRHGLDDIATISADPTRRISDLEAEVDCLRKKLAEATAENDSKDRIIVSLQSQLASEDEKRRRHENLQSQLNQYWTSKTKSQRDLLRKNISLKDDMSEAENSLAQCSLQGSMSSMGSSGVRGVVNEIQSWLFLEGGNLRDVEGLITEYCIFCRSIGMPLDRLFIAGMMLHPNVSAYVWKWEQGSEFNEHEVPHSAFEKPNYNPDEPFAVLMEGRAMEYRMSPHDEEIPPGCSWFINNNYQDYLALPIYHRGQFKGAMAWCTKDLKGFSKAHIEIFHQSLAALSTVLRLHTNDLVMRTLMGRLEQEVLDQTEELQKANLQLEEANTQIISQSQAQLQHFAMMSHEIRTPLNGIVGISNLLKEETNLSDEVREGVGMLSDSGELLLAVVNDVLDYSKLTSGKVEIEMEPTNLRQCIQPVIHSIELKATKENLKLQTSFGPTVPTSFIEMDGRRLQQILYNLLGNAVKFGGKDKVIDFSIYIEEQEELEDEESTCTVPLSVQSPEHKDDLFFMKSSIGCPPTMCISVKDYGKGIASSELNKIFEPFKQASTNSPTDGGTGLGLAITSQLVEALGGTITVDSVYGKFCEFMVKIPIKESEIDASFSSIVSETIKTELTASSTFFGDSIHSISTVDEGTSDIMISPETKRGSLSGSLAVKFDNVRVLIAEDNLVNQKVLSRTLARMGIKNVDIVENGLLALEATSKKDYDIIFMDWQMPIMDGLEATMRIKKRCKDSDTPIHVPKIVFLTAHAFPDYEDKAAEAKADGFISKPFKKQMIEEKLVTLGLGFEKQ